MIKISEEKEIQLVLPINTSEGTIERVMKALFELNAFSKSTSLDDLSKISGISKKNLSPVISFLVAIKAIEKKGTSEIILTENGKNYAQALSWGLEEDSKRFLRLMLIDYDLTKRIISYVRVQKNVTMDELVKRIGIFSEKKMTVSIERAINSFIDITISCQILKDEDGIIKAPEISYDDVKDIPIKDDDEKVIKTTKRISETKYPITINIKIDSSMSTEEIIEKIKAIRKGLIEPLD